MPTFAVRESLRPLPEQVHTVQGRPCMIQVRERLMPLLRLADLFGDRRRARPTSAAGDGRRHRGRRPAGGAGRRRLLGKQEVVIKSLGDTFAGRARRRGRRDSRRRPDRTDSRRARHRRAACAAKARGRHSSVGLGWRTSMTAADRQPSRADPRSATHDDQRRLAGQVPDVRARPARSTGCRC